MVKEPDIEEEVKEPEFKQENKKTLIQDLQKKLFHTKFIEFVVSFCACEPSVLASFFNFWFNLCYCFCLSSGLFLWRSEKILAIMSHTLKVTVCISLRPLKNPYQYRKMRPFQ